MNPCGSYDCSSSEKEQVNLLIKSHVSLVDFLVERMSFQIPHFMSREEVTSAAMTGLIDAAQRFDPSKGFQFRTFAEWRIRGAVYDEVRKMDWCSRSARQKQTRLNQTIHDLENKLGREPGEVEIAEALGMSLDDYYSLLSQISHLGCVSLHEFISESFDDMTFQDILEDPQAVVPENRIEMQELTDSMAQSIKELNEKEQLIISLFYYEELTQKEIAEVLELTEGRISQLHSQALHKLKVKMGKRLHNHSSNPVSPA